MTVFPKDVGELGGLSFTKAFETLPKWVEFVRECWTDNCTGVFLAFQKYVTERLADDEERKKHAKRCQEFVKRTKLDEIPRYLLKYR